MQKVLGTFVSCCRVNCHWQLTIAFNASVPKRPGAKRKTDLYKYNFGFNGYFYTGFCWGFVAIFGYTSGSTEA